MLSHIYVNLYFMTEEIKSVFIWLGIVSTTVNFVIAALPNMRKQHLNLINNWRKNFFC